jgi:hypothetical protein
MGRRTRDAAQAHQSPEARRHARALTWRRMAEGAKLGAFGGGLFAALALVVGGVRFLLAMVGERTILGPTTWHDARSLLVYIAAFIVGGIGVGVVHAVWKNRALTAVAFMAAGALLMNAIVYTDGGAGSYDRVDALWMTGIGCLFGLAAAYGATKRF